MNKRYQVEINHSVITSYEVYAENTETAQEKALEMARNGVDGFEVSEDVEVTECYHDYDDMSETEL